MAAQLPSTLSSSDGLEPAENDGALVETAQTFAAADARSRRSARREHLQLVHVFSGSEERGSFIVQRKVCMRHETEVGSALEVR